MLNGIAPLVALLGEAGSPRLQEGAAWVLGTAASNNHKFTGQLLEAEPGIVADLLKVCVLMSRLRCRRRKRCTRLHSSIRSPVFPYPPRHTTIHPPPHTHTNPHVHCTGGRREG